MKKLTGNTPHPNRTDYFTDTNDPLVCAAYEIGIVGGYPDGTFRPNQLLTRQEFFVIISNLNRCVNMPIHLTKDYLAGFIDRNEVGTWAESAAQEVVGLGICRRHHSRAMPPIWTPPAPPPVSRPLSCSCGAIKMLRHF